MARRAGGCARGGAGRGDFAEVYVKGCQSRDGAAGGADAWEGGGRRGGGELPQFGGGGGVWTKEAEPRMNGFQRFMADPKKAWEERLTRRNDELFKPLTVAKPNAGHVALVELERLGILRFVITQNIDDLHRQAGQKELAEIHGNGTLIRCPDCTTRFHEDAMSLQNLPPAVPRRAG